MGDTDYYCYYLDTARVYNWDVKQRRLAREQASK